MLHEEKGLTERQSRWLLPLELTIERRVRALPALADNMHASRAQALAVARQVVAANKTLEEEIRARRIALNLLDAQREQAAGDRRKA
ncbi:MAG: hypothetical protein KDA41_04315, partial [Planctomycetales bacterium]|nr:hypothetical protein [Planctomycetales bacterium]